MKRFITMLLFVAMLSSCTQYSETKPSQPETTLGTESGSDEAAAGDTTTEIESQSQEETEAVLDVVTGLTTYYIRGKDGSTSDAVSTLIRTEEDYKEYCEKEKNFVSKEEFQEAAEHFDKDFWEKYDLLMVGRGESSGSIRHEVLTMTGGNGYWDITVRCLVPVVQSADMAWWTFLIEVPEGLVKDEDVIRMVYTKN